MAKTMFRWRTEPDPPSLPRFEWPTEALSEHRWKVCWIYSLQALRDVAELGHVPSLAKLADDRSGLGGWSGRELAKWLP